MFRKIRKIKNEINQAEAKELLKNSRRGILAMNGDDGYPYAIPVNYFYDETEGKIFFHGAKAGYKVDCLKSSYKVCFTVIGSEMIREEAWAPYMRSVVIFGRCQLIDDKQNAMKRLKDFAMKYYPREEMVLDEIKADGKATQMFEIDIEHMTGKEVQEK
ncbi:MAG: pyridoxamine 5'-phosphate oxidase family protein [Clostridiales bacterium]|nr:pyridoxamine 5'-phosphate oxidase family protein [Clostridiales bacterium]MDY6116838.1 pyridoxamine 5'-phosphate oxidase family protein [Anaerovoracaceae bacterium]